MYDFLAEAEPHTGPVSILTESLARNLPTVFCVAAKSPSALRAGSLAQEFRRFGCTVYAIGVDPSCPPLSDSNVVTQQSVKREPVG